MNFQVINSGRLKPEGLYILQLFDEKGQQVKTEKVIIAK